MTLKHGVRNLIIKLINLEVASLFNAELGEVMDKLTLPPGQAGTRQGNGVYLATLLLPHEICFVFPVQF